MNKIKYLCSPYSHTDPSVTLSRYDAICRVAADFMRRGEIVFSPIAHSHAIATRGGLDPTHGFDWLRQDLAILARCDEVVVIMLDGWQDSMGIAAERAEAKRLGIPVTFYWDEKNR